MDQSQVNRREFLKTSGVAAATTSAVVNLATASARAAGANGKIRIGFIGPGGRGFGAHVKSLVELQKQGAKIELVAVSDVYSVHADRAADYIKEQTGVAPKKYDDYREMIKGDEVDAVCIGTPDHWHAKQTIDSMKAGKHVYCEKPMTHTVEEALEVVKVWKETGKIMQVGVQSTSLPLWGKVQELLQEGKLGKVLQFQTEYFRNSQMGQWRYYSLSKEMSPKTINWRKWLGVDDGLAPDRPFDREVYAQWRRFWDFGSGMFTDLFVHRTTSMLKATGLRFPGRIVGAGGIFLEYDGRDVPDVATVVADFHEGVQATVTATMCAQETPIKQLIRGHFGSFEFGNGEEFTGFDFIPERPQITHDGKLKKERIDVASIKNTTLAHFKNWVEAMETGKQELCNNPPDLGAAAIVIVNLGARSYREGKVYQFDPTEMKVSHGDGSWSKKWEQMSHTRSKPVHIPGWKAGDYGSQLEEPAYMALGGPWVNGQPPAADAAAGGGGEK